MMAKPQKEHEWLQQLGVSLDDDAVDQVARGVRQHQSGNPVDCHQQEPERKQSPSRPDQLPYQGQNGA